LSDNLTIGDIDIDDEKVGVIEKVKVLLIDDEKELLDVLDKLGIGVSEIVLLDVLDKLTLGDEETETEFELVIIIL